MAGPASPPYAPGVLHAGLPGPAPRLDFTQEQIYEAVWHEFPEDCGATVVNIISQLRRKMGLGNPIRTVPHSGYKFELSPIT